MADLRRLPGPTADQWEWQLHAACRGLDSSSFFNDDGERAPFRSRREAAAKQLCRGCPVLAQCREHALEVREPYGVWGGLSSSEREQLQRGRRRRLVIAGDRT